MTKPPHRQADFPNPDDHDSTPREQTAHTHSDSESRSKLGDELRAVRVSQQLRDRLLKIPGKADELNLVEPINTDRQPASISKPSYNKPRYQWKSIAISTGLIAATVAAVGFFIWLANQNGDQGIGPEIAVPDELKNPVDDDKNRLVQAQESLRNEIDQIESEIQQRQLRLAMIENLAAQSKLKALKQNTSSSNARTSESLSEAGIAELLYRSAELSQRLSEKSDGSKMNMHARDQYRLVATRFEKTPWAKLANAKLD